MANTNNWVIDNTHSEISFKVRHLMISNVTGYFREFDGALYSDSENLLDGKFSFAAKIDSIDTNQKDRDAHLKSADFFDMESYPELKFESTEFKDGKLHGTITIRGNSQPIALDVDFNGVVQDGYGQTKAGFEIEGALNRKDFGLNYSSITEAGGVVVGDKVRLFANIQFTKQD